jgi:hypothetical protein
VFRPAVFFRQVRLIALLFLQGKNLARFQNVIISVMSSLVVGDLRNCERQGVPACDSDKVE